MKATELMTGDWVCLKDDTKCEFPLKVDGVLTDDISLEGEGFLGGVDGLIRPIPITPEILEKNGWHFDLTPYEKDLNECCGMSIDKHWCYADTNIDISLFFPITGVEMGRLDVNNHHLKRYLEFVLRDTLYVHEMQNALRLCGLNELADNFKV